MLVICFIYGSYIAGRAVRENNLYSADDMFIYAVTKLNVVSPALRQEAPLAVNECIVLLRQRLRTLCKVYITFFQIVSNLPSVLQLENVPESYSQRISAIGIVVNIGISQSAIFSCLTGTSFDFIDRLLMDTICPAIVSLLFITVYYGHISWKFGVMAIWLQRATAMTEVAIAAVRSKYLATFLLYIYLIWPSLTATIFQSFECQNVDPDGVESGDDYYLRADYSISCSSARYKFARVWAALMIVVYVLGVPGFYAYMLVCNRADIKRQGMPNVTREARSPFPLAHQRLSAITMLYENYKPELWYWELVESSYRLSLTGFLVVAGLLRASGQILVGFLLAFVFAKLYEHKKPIKDPFCQICKEISQWEVLFVFFVIILMETEFLGVGTLSVLALLLLVVVCAHCVLSFCYVCHQFRVSTSSDNADELSQRERAISLPYKKHSSPCKDQGSAVTSPLATLVTTSLEMKAEQPL